MSTFGGVMVEFPDIRVDFFRLIKDKRPPLACFLSHVHSDHLAGLESFKSPFIYCSAATKELLLKLEKYQHRLNYANNLFEARKVQYKHLQNLLKPIPLETPTTIELSPGHEIQVTLFDANHCSGAVMFLFEDNDKAILYTGDVRSEPWFVNNLTRNPFLIEYTSGLKRLDCIYLDTSNLGPIVFPTKADGLKELLEKVSKYPKDTVFHFIAWTFGYEEVWMALSKALKSPIHVDKYKLRLYKSLRGDFVNKHQSFTGPLAHEGPALAGYICGNTPQEGCLTSEADVRLHSCEKGMYCEKIDNNTVWIRPIIARTKDGVELGEIGVGGGGGDLTQGPEMELDDFVIEQLMELFVDNDPEIQEHVKNRLLSGLRTIRQTVTLDDAGLSGDEDVLSLPQLKEALKKSFSNKQNENSSSGPDNKLSDGSLPKVITFPYSRHSSYAELCDLVRVFKPKDIYPCTVDAIGWHQDRITMASLFGHVCSANSFRHDEEMTDIISQFPMLLSSQPTQMSQPATQSLENIESSPTQKILSEVLSRENEQSCIRLRPFESQENVSSKGSSSLSIATPPRVAIAVSPGSASQGVRRKAIHDGLAESRAKRIRLQFDDHESDPIIEQKQENETPRQKIITIDLTGDLDGTTMINTPSTDPDDPAPDEDREIQNPISLETAKPPSFSVWRDEHGKEIGWDDDDESQRFGYWNTTSYENEYNLDDNIFFDLSDEVYRCKFCGHEFWAKYVGFCTNCKQGQTGIPYLEIIEPGAGPQADIEFTDSSEDICPDSDLREVAGDYLDDGSSAYDTYDEGDANSQDEYETNSMIDDESQDSDEEETHDDEEPDYKAMYEQLQAEHGMLQRKCLDLEDFQRDVLGLDYDSELDMDVTNHFDHTDYEMDDEMDEDGILVVDVVTPDPVLSEVVLSQSIERDEDRDLEFTDVPESLDDPVRVVLSQADGQSQVSEITEDRLHARAEAFEVVKNGGDWNEVLLMSVDDNHTHEEIEL